MNDNEIKEIFEKYKKIAVIGLSPNSSRPSFGVTKYLVNAGFDVVGVRPGIREVMGLKVYESLTAVPQPIEIVDVFRNSEFVPQIVDEAIRVKAKVLWLQEGVTHQQAEERARAAGLKVISDRCILKEHRRLL